MLVFGCSTKPNLPQSVIVEEDGEVLTLTFKDNDYPQVRIGTNALGEDRFDSALMAFQDSVWFARIENPGRPVAYAFMINENWILDPLNPTTINHRTGTRSMVFQPVKKGD